MSINKSTGCICAILILFMGGIDAFGQKGPGAPKPHRGGTGHGPSSTGIISTGESEETLAGNTVQAFSHALIREKYVEASNFLTSSARKEWYDPEAVGQGDAAHTELLIFSMNKKAGGIIVKVKDKLVGYDGGKAFQVIHYFLVKEGGRWLIDQRQFGKHRIVSAPNPLNHESAKVTVANFLTARVKGRLKDTRTLVTNRFAAKQDKFYFTDPVSEVFHEFDILKTVEKEGAIWIYAEELWHSGPEQIRYKVIEQGGELRIDEGIFRYDVYGNQDEDW